MSRDEISKNLSFLQKYTKDLKERDEYTVQMLAGSKETKEEIINNLFRIIKDYEALLGQDLRKKRAKRFQGTKVNR